MNKTIEGHAWSFVRQKLMVACNASPSLKVGMRWVGLLCYSLFRHAGPVSLQQTWLLLLAHVPFRCASLSFANIFLQKEKAVFYETQQITGFDFKTQKY